MAIETEATLSKISVLLKLNNGLIPGTSEVQTTSLPLPDINPDTYDAGKAYEVANALSQCLSKTLYMVDESRVSRLTPKE